MLLARGAEAELRPMEWHGRPAVEKVRLRKAYRDEGLDDAIRRERMRAEVRLMADARRAGVSVPILYDVDLKEHRLVMERVEGPTVKEVLQSRREDPTRIARLVGHLVGTLHANGLVHGDLTTSNLLWWHDRVYAIDFSMGERTDGFEARGVDLRLLKEGWGSAHHDLLDRFDDVLAAYRAAFPGAGEALATLRSIEERRRYA